MRCLLATLHGWDKARAFARRRARAPLATPHAIVLLRRHGHVKVLRTATPVIPWVLRPHVLGAGPAMLLKTWRWAAWSLGFPVMPWAAE